ncbi:hypothetical protein EYB53_021430 [Candidatus Chloroploca sp. M-50]|uniref:Uncharacterized protein n=1 Tax=Candidatus Chloroploca mongolica TaxID=2528176 RepID=A0ABS4DFS8_9CHLR|nr:hypothetical protein [Candidatus Chloroploca mongolica]MBP1468287.1 hypothetical protein [Candidatus Chloroploca mongolica]
MSDNLWFFLANESFRQRGEGFQREWSFHMLAAKRGLGMPLTRSLPFAEQIRVGNQTYGHQPFARDLLFNPSTFWLNVRSLNDELQDKPPSTTSLGFHLLRHAFPRSIGASNPPEGIATHTAFERDWTFHQEAIRLKLGMALSGNYAISPEPNLLVQLQVFAGDTLYSTEPPFRDALRLSDLAPDDPLYHPLWFEAYKVAQALFGNETFGFNPHFHNAAREARLGAPLSGWYRTSHEGVPYDMQIFAFDTLYSPLAGPILRWSQLDLPQEVRDFPEPSGDEPIPVTGEGKIPSTQFVSQWLKDHPTTPDPIRKLIRLALRVLYEVNDSRVLAILTAKQRAQMRGSPDVVCADLVSMCLKEAGVNTLWNVTQPPGTAYRGDRAANYFRPEPHHPLLRYVPDHEPWLPGDILVYKDFFHAVAGWLPDEYHHVVIYVGPFSGKDRGGRVYPESRTYSVVSSSIYSPYTSGATRDNAARASYFGYGSIVRVRHREIEQLYRDAGIIA